jgi:O-antigen/teichoic acid export membrane protein
VLLAPLLVTQLVGEAFVPAIFATQVLLVGATMRLFGFWFRPFYLSAGRVRFWLALSAASALISAPAYLIGASLGGYRGVAVAQLCKVLFNNTIAGVRAANLMRRVELR